VTGVEAVTDGSAQPATSSKRPLAHRSDLLEIAAKILVIGVLPLRSRPSVPPGSPALGDFLAEVDMYMPVALSSADEP
jgi:hypothetical protein